MQALLKKIAVFSTAELSQIMRSSAEPDSLSSINVAVDACNAISLHNSLPMSVVDLDLGGETIRVCTASEGTAYVFNRSGQTIGVAGLLCQFDVEGSCANAVKESQRVKTTPPGTHRTLSLIWSANNLPRRAAETEAWYHELLKDHGANVESCWP